MSCPAHTDPAAYAMGRAVNTKNAVTAAACGLLPAAWLAWRQLPAAWMWIVGLLVGFLWANAFEYALHRGPLHWPGTWTGDGHLLHHASLGQPNEPLYVNLAGRPLLVIGMFVLNIWPFLLVDHFFRTNVSSGVLLSFAAYFVLSEEIHWRYHMGETPRWLARMRELHLRHHDIPTTDFSIFLPLFDVLLGTASRRR